jgi:uncharacterized membrane protein/mono/diheme cytochrome c family protein/YHS domain-containing protein
VNSLSSWIEVFGRLHPALLHFPIGIIAALVALELVALLRGRPARENAAAESTLVWVAALAAWIAVATGYTLGLEDGYEADRLQLHMRLGIASATGTSAVVFAYTRYSRAVYRALLFATMGLLAVAGHFGSGLVRGDGFLMAPLTAPSATTTPKIDRSTYRDKIAPIFAARCGACHGETKQKGDLKLTTPEALFAGGATGSTLVPNHPEKSELVRRAHLPIDDEDHMPPDGKAQLTAAELAAIEAWIKAGAPLEGVVSEAEKFSAAPAAPGAIAALRGALAHVAPVMADSDILEVDLSPIGAAATDEEVARLLDPLRENVARLSLARCSITDRALATVARMPQLARLDLSSTPVTDGGIASLATHPALRELVLVRTRLTDAAVETLLRIPALERVYVWQSGIGSDAIARLRRDRPALVVEAGDELTKPALEIEPALGAPAPINTLCPVSGTPVDASHTLVFEGRVVGFCCGKCPAKFSADPAAFASKLP